SEICSSVNPGPSSSTGSGGCSVSTSVCAIGVEGGAGTSTGGGVGAAPQPVRSNKPSTDDVEVERNAQRRIKLTYVVLESLSQKNVSFFEPKCVTMKHQ